jgi:hypothetical protein
MIACSLGLQLELFAGLRAEGVDDEGQRGPGL